MGTSRIGIIEPTDLVVDRVRVRQSAAGQTTLKAAQLGVRHSVDAMLLTMSADGTIEFFSGANSLTGDMDVAQRGGFSFSNLGELIQTNPGEALIMTTTVGAARGVVRVVSE